MIKAGFAALLMIFSSGFAQTAQRAQRESGTIVGTVVDHRSGESLYSVNIVIDGTYLGAATNLDGYYSILNVPAGIYGLKASMIGYAPQRRDSVLVRLGDTVHVDFRMRDMCAVWADIARKDLAEGKVRLLSGGLTVFTVPRDEVDKLTRKYGFVYDLMGCTFMCEQEYNEVVMKYLEARNGVDWWERYIRESEALQKRYR
jgi:hypothetical protein